MKIGDKIKVIETGRVGWIIGETRTGWKIDFADGNKPELVLKTVAMEIVEHQGSNGGYQGDGSKPKKKKKWLLIAILVLLIGGAIALTIYNVI